MKKLIVVLFLSITALAAVAQTNAIPTTPAAFLNEAESFFSSFNTNLNWTATKVDLWTAGNYQSGLQTSAELGGSYDLWSPTTNLAVAPEVVFRNAGIAGTIVSAAGGAGLSYEHYDLKITGYVDTGYSPSLDSGFAEVGVRLKKKMTVSTYIGLGLGYQKYFNSKFDQSTPSVSAYVGWTF